MLLLINQKEYCLYFLELFLFFKLAYDKILNARKAVEQRHRKLDSQRKKFKEELDAREQQAHSGSYFSSTTNADEERLKVLLLKNYF